MALLTEIVEERQDVHKQLTDFYKCTDDACKVLIIKHWGGGRVRAWLYDKDNRIPFEVRDKALRDGHHRLVRELERVAPIVLEKFLEKMPEMKAMLDDVNQLREREGKELKGDYTALHYGLQTVERRLLGHLKDFLGGRGYDVTRLSKQYDGLYLWREGVEGDFPLDVLRDAEAYMASKDLGGGLQVPMKLKEKSVRGPYPLLQL